MLIIAPFHDIPTRVSVDAALRLVSWAEEKGYAAALMYGWTAIRPVFWLAKGAEESGLIAYYGHGDEKHLCGFLPLTWCIDYLSVLDMTNLAWGSGKIIYSMACEAGKKLGPMLVRLGAKAVFAATYSLYAFFPEIEHDYLEDWIDVMTVIPKALMEGKTAGEAYAKYKETWKKYLSLYASKKDEWANSDWYYGAGKVNMEQMRLFGDPNASL